MLSVLRSGQQLFSHFSDGFLGLTSTKQWECIPARPGYQEQGYQI